MATDLKLDQGGGGWLVAEADVLKTTAADLMLDSPGRRAGAGGPHRRALVHGQGDQLVLNFAGDYSGGVTVPGTVTASGDVVVTGRLHLRGASTSVEDVDDLQRVLASLAGMVDECRRRLDRLENQMTTLTSFVGAAEIPQWLTREEVENGDDMGLRSPSAESLGLVVEYVVLQADPRYGDGEVVSIDPPPGTVVARGSTVRVTINLEG